MFIPVTAPCFGQAGNEEGTSRPLAPCGQRAGRRRGPPVTLSPPVLRLFERGFTRVVCSRAGSVTSGFSHGLLWIALAVHRVHVHHRKVRRLPSPQAGVFPSGG